jgi:NADH:ubiquinone oxidoreductase subunit K
MKTNKIQVAVCAVCLTAGAVMTAVLVQIYHELNKLELRDSQQAAADSKLHTTKLLVSVVVALYVVACAIVAIVPWRSWGSRQFSLKTLLIATTLFAVGLGLAVYAARK